MDNKDEKSCVQSTAFKKKIHAKGHLDACLNKLGHEDVLESCVMLKKYLLEIFKIQISLLMSMVTH